MSKPMERATIKSVRILVAKVAGLLNVEGRFRIEGAKANRINFGHPVSGGISNPAGQTITEAYNWLYTFYRGVETALRQVGEEKVVVALDQKGEPVPSDLVLLDLTPASLAAPELREIDSLDWYEPDFDPFGTTERNRLLVSLAALRDCLHDPDAHTFTTAEEANIEPVNGVEFIDQRLHRWSKEDGFYHA